MPTYDSPKSNQSNIGRGHTYTPYTNEEKKKRVMGRDYTPPAEPKKERGPIRLNYNSVWEGGSYEGLERRMFRGLPQVLTPDGWRWDATAIKSAGFGDAGQNIIDNLRQVPIDTGIDFSNMGDDPFKNLTKEGYLSKANTWNVKDWLNDSGNPSGAGAWARYVVPALAALPIGAGAASQFGVFGGTAGSAAAPGISGAGGGAVHAGFTPSVGPLAAAAVPESAALGGGSAFASESLGGAGVSGVAAKAPQILEKAIAAGTLSKAGDFILDNAGRIIGTTATVIAAIANDNNSDSGSGEDVTPYDPTSSDYWNEFVDEWMDAKGMYLEDDAFKKSEVEPAVGEYQSVLADLANQANTGTGNYAPITFGMGDFRSSFVPKSGFRTAQDIGNYAKDKLTSSLALTDVMQPNKGNRDYLSDLMDLARYDRGFNLSQWAAENNLNLDQQRVDYETSDKGTWLDAVKDILQVGDTSQDIWDKLFDKD